MTSTNGYDREVIAALVARIDKLDDELLTLRGEYMAACKGPRSRIKDVMAEAREAEVNMTAFRELLHSHRDDRKRQARIDALEADDRDAYELLEEALGEFGDTELGRAALKRAKPKGDDEALSDLQR
jgi:hypothetical protein